jgi:hypothetical protein
LAATERDGRSGDVTGSVQSTFNEVHEEISKASLQRHHELSSKKEPLREKEN